MGRKNFLGLMTLGLASLIFSACSETEKSGSGRVNVYLTDAPTENSELSGVFITISKVELKGSDGWITVQEFEAPKTINLLNYQEGDTYFLGDTELAPGSYTEARLLLQIDEEDTDGYNPSCYLEYTNGAVQPLFLPSGEQSGYKAIGSIEVSPNGTSNVIMDFDVRKAVIKSGASDKYILKPNIRLVSNHDIGDIEGGISSESIHSRVVVFAYADGTFNEAELEASQNNNAFENAISSTKLNSDGTFKLAFLNKGTYDLYFVSYDAEGNIANIEAEHQDVLVLAQETTTLALDIELIVGL